MTGVLDACKVETRDNAAPNLVDVEGHLGAVGSLENASSSGQKSKDDGEEERQGGSQDKGDDLGDRLTQDGGEVHERARGLEGMEAGKTDAQKRKLLAEMALSAKRLLVLP